MRTKTSSYGQVSPPNDWLVSRAPTELDENWPRREALECERAAKQP